jgi:hypothetical protein
MARKLGEPLIAAPMSFSMIATLIRISKRCRIGLRAGCLLARVLVIALRGLLRSWRAQDPTADLFFRRNRHAAYSQLWAELERVYWRLREPQGNAPTLRELPRDVDTFIGSTFLYIRETDQELLVQYVLSLQRLRDAICLLIDNDPAARESAARPTLSRFVDINAVTQETIDLRNRVLQQIRRALPSD